MSEKGVFAVDRGAFDHPLFNEKRIYSRLEAWLWMLSEASWKPSKRQISGKITELSRGQFTHSVRFMAEAWGWSKSSVDRFLTRLKTETMIGTETGTGVLIITICKYDEYQKVSLPKRDDVGTPSGTAAGQQRDRLEDTESSESKDTSLRSLAPQAAPAKKRGTRLDENWVLPKHFGEWALEQGMSRERIMSEANKMRDWSINAGKLGVKVDWFAAWRGWITRALEQRGPSAPGPSNPRPTRNDILKEMQERLNDGQGGNERDFGTASGDGGFLSITEFSRQ